MANQEWPKTAAELKATGYVWQRWAVCRGCSKQIGWVLTPQERLMMPLIEVERPLTAPAGERYFSTHFADCPQSRAFSGRGRKRRGNARS